MEWVSRRNYSRPAITLSETDALKLNALENELKILPGNGAAGGFFRLGGQLKGALLQALLVDLEAFRHP